MNKTCFSCGQSKPVEEFRQIAGKRYHICIHCETHRWCSYCGKEKSLEAFPESTGKPPTVCSECEAWKIEHLKCEDNKIEIEYNGF